MGLSRPALTGQTSTGLHVFFIPAGSVLGNREAGRRMYVRIPRPALPAASALAAVCAVAVGTPGRVGVGVPERAVISGRNPLPPPRGGPGSAQRLPDLLRDDRGRVLAGDYREKRGDRVL